MENSSIFTQLNKLILENSPVKYMEKGRYLFQESTSATELFYILSGKVQVNKLVPDGRELTLRLCSHDEIVGESILFSNGPKHTTHAKVIESGEVAVIHKEHLEQEILKNGQLAVEVLTWLASQHRKTQSILSDLVLNGKKGALYSTIIRLTNSYGKEDKNGIVIMHPFTNQELANFCGTSREVVNRMLTDLRKKDVLSINKGILTVHNIEFLKREINCTNCPIDICSIK
jgi:CRP-like cAMP-binding protein